MAGFVRADGERNLLEGGCVNASRSVTFPEGSAEATSVEAWADIIAQAIDTAQADLMNAAI